MKELTERSRELQDTILRNPSLLKDLSERVAELLKGKVELPEDSVYLFMPKVYRRPLFLPEVYMMAVDLDRLPHGPWPKPGPFPGPLDPWLVHLLEKARIKDAPIPVSHAAKQADPTPEPAGELHQQILANPTLFVTLSEGIAEVLARHGVSLGQDETYAFEAVTLRRPVFGGELATPVIPLPPPRATLAPWAATPIHLPRWYQGIPPVEMLVALERLRLGAH